MDSEAKRQRVGSPSEVLGDPRPLHEQHGLAECGGDDPDMEHELGAAALNERLAKMAARQGSYVQEPMPSQVKIDDDASAVLASATSMPLNFDTLLKELNTKGDQVWSLDLQTTGRAAFRAMLRVPKAQPVPFLLAHEIMSSLLAHPFWSPIVPSGYTEESLLLGLARSIDHRDVRDASENAHHSLLPCIPESYAVGRLCV
jgi:hypothetical protein